MSSQLLRNDGERDQTLFLSAQALWNMQAHQSCISKGAQTTFRPATGLIDLHGIRSQYGPANIGGNPPQAFERVRITSLG